MCSTGQCGWCECEVDGVPSVRTCRVAARDGLVVRSEHSLPTVRRDVLGVLDWGSRFVPPTFYHHRFLRPRALRKAYLDVIRWFGGRGRLPGPGAASRGRGELRRERVDVLVVGAGPSGLAAAGAARQAGARVVVLEADVPPFWKPQDASEGQGQGDGGAGIDIRLGTTALGWYAGIVGAVDGHGAIELETGVIVVATGTHERVPLVSGADRPGMLAARLVTGLIERHAILPGRSVVLIGEAAALANVATLLSGAGASVDGPYPTASLLAVTGRRRVTGVRLRDGLGTRMETADSVVFSDRGPSVELLLQAGAATTWGPSGPVPMVDDAGRTSVPGVFAVGGSAGASGQEAAAVECGIAAAAYAAELTSGTTPTWNPARPARGAQVAERAERTDTPNVAHASVAYTCRDRYPSAAAIVCFCEDVRVREVTAEVHAGYGDPELMKRRTGALTGPCQGKYCLAALACAATAAAPPAEAAAAPDAGAWLPPTGRPPVRPVRLGDLAVSHHLATADEA